MPSRARRCSRVGAIAIAIATLPLGSCTDYIRGAPMKSVIVATANPEFIVADGGVSVISALVLEPAGTTAADGTVVQFFTNLGRIDEQVLTKDGVARSNLVSDGRSGMATIKVLSGGATMEKCHFGTNEAADDCGIAIGSALPARVLLVADPPALRTNRTSQLTVNVFDKLGNPVSNVPVFFSVAAAGAVTMKETLDSGGRPRFTDSNGQAFDTLSSREAYTGATAMRSVRVTASLPLSTSLKDEIIVVVN